MRDASGKVTMSAHVECTSADVPALTAFLEKHAATSLFLLENLRTKGIAAQRTEGPSYVMAMRGDAVTGVASMNEGGMLLVQAPAEALTLSARALRNAATPLRGILGPTAQVTEVLEGLALTAAPARMHSEELLYELALDAVSESTHADDFAVRLATAQDVDALARFRRAYRLEALGAKDDAALDATARAEAEAMSRDGLTFVLANDRDPVAMTTFSARHRSLVQVGGVYTPAPLRGRGYGRRVVAGSLAHAKRAWGATRSVPFTAAKNVSAQRAYEALGYRRSGGFTLHFFEEPLDAAALRAKALARAVRRS